MDAIARYGSIFVEGATTSVKAGAKLCFWAALLTICSSIGMIISQNIENKLTTCSFSDLRKYDESCLTEYLNNNKKFIPFRIFLRLFDVCSSVLLIAVGNCLENVFKNTTMARVMGGTLRLACFMVIFEICYYSGLELQQHDFAKYWTLNLPRKAQIVSTYMFMDHSADVFWTLDNLLYTYFLLLLGYLSSDNEKFSKGYSTTAFIGFICGFLNFFLGVFSTHRHRWLWNLIVFCYFGLQIAELVIIIWTGKALSGMEGDLVGKRGKKGKKGKKHRKGNRA